MDLDANVDIDVDVEISLGDDGPWSISIADTIYISSVQYTSWSLLGLLSQATKASLTHPAGDLSQ